jgi:hypothetical protein
MKTNKLILCILDNDAGVEDSWQLTAKPCRAVAGKNVAELLATNCELASW